MAHTETAPEFLTTVSVDPREMESFTRMAEDWWNPSGKFKPLHVMNGFRISLIKNLLCDHFLRDPNADQPLAGLRILDIGCGGGLLCEPITRLGATVTGVDALDLMARMARLLDDQNVPEEGRWFVAPPSFYEELSQSGSKLLSVDFNAGQGSIRNGLVSSGKLRGFDMYKSNNVPSVSTATGQCLGGHISSTATANTILSTEVIRDPSSFGDIVRGLHVFGRKVLRSEALQARHLLID